MTGSLIHFFFVGRPASQLIQMANAKSSTTKEKKFKKIKNPFKTKRPRESGNLHCMGSLSLHVFPGFSLIWGFWTAIAAPSECSHSLWSFSSTPSHAYRTKEGSRTLLFKCLYNRGFSSCSWASPPPLALDLLPFSLPIVTLILTAKAWMA